ncbi:MAG: RnfABCDGE type electron transport complex subunit D [Candidatus Abyssobacteria bacterium SURF_5]|uniref:Ion-translocating oxidoreductase complex subunit D n=1 Tax=Abyssobacteria bacterium (strain SURF_5) TaxID=2093360 RepID=A0A3A4NQR0_ABYX5|nr:MAG: RnfABCDGE type electron transport complex subunit D [Candidatus Abyssubacteria bacterium SURF_5]
MDRQLVVTTPPHIRSAASVNRIMADVHIALAPVTIAGVYLFGFRSAVLLAVSVLAAVVTEAAIEKILKWDVTIGDYSAALTGLFVGLVLPPGAPLWLGAIGSAFSIAVAKMAFGGLGKNIFNPALAGRVMLLAAWPIAMTKGWLQPLWWRQEGFSFWTLRVADRLGISVDVITSATPLAKGGAPDPYTMMDLFTGRVGGCIGETSAAALLIGGAYLIYRRLIYWQLPASFIATTGILMWAFGGQQGLFTGDFMMHVLAGGLILGAFFMATDMVTSPITIRGQLIMGIGCGAITALVRLKGGPPEGVSYSILIMNAFTPLIDKYTVPRPFGEKVS